MGKPDARPRVAEHAERQSSPFVPEVQPAAWAGRLVGDYHLLLEMGRSLTDTTFLARMEGTRSTDKLTVVRELDEHLGLDSAFINAFLEEAYHAFRIRHPHLVRIVELGNFGRSLYVVTEYVHGQSMSDLVRSATKRNLSLPWHYVARIVADGADGLHAAHELTNEDGEPLNLVHRKLSLENLLVGYDGQVKIADLGMARAVEKFEENAPEIRAKRAAYMSPEQVRGEKPDRRSDIFSLGVVMFESLCQKRLFGELADEGLMAAVQEATVPRPRKMRPDIPREVERIIVKALAKDPDQRYATAGQMADALEEALAAHRRPVSGRKLAKIMDRLFGEHKKLKDQQIKNALTQTRLPTMEGAGLLAGTTATIDISRVEFTDMRYLERRKAGKGLFVAGAGFFVAAVALVLFSWFRSSSEPSGRTTTARTPARAGKQNDRRATKTDGPKPGTPGAKHPKRTTVILSVTVKPQQARVEIYFRGRKYKGSQLKLVLPRSDQMVELKIRARGYVPQSVVVAPTEDRQVAVTLVSGKARAHPRGGRGARTSRPL